MSFLKKFFQMGFDFSNLIIKINEKKINVFSFISIPLLIICVVGLTYCFQQITGIEPDKISSGRQGISEIFMFGWLFLYFVGTFVLKEYFNIYFIIGAIQSIFLILCRALVVFLTVQTFLFLVQLFLLNFTSYNVKQIMTFDYFFEIVPVLFCYVEATWFFKCYIKRERFKSND